ncbi:RRM domain containing protein [Cryptosporidium canis]|uniref:RRM domain containing protein n=1 Tax=Cryptosporidium canis TaxID=195482 RepID=A0A9D5DJ36_9CRYT|nr:RRM domain containing protein [Cryptosporidium canis]
MTENCVFIRNLSPLANKESVLKIFSDLEDEITQVNFHNYPDSDQRFCQISFKSSNGVTRSISFNGSTLLGVPMSITVLPPIKIEKLDQKRIVSNREISVKYLPESYSDSRILSIFEKYGKVVGIKRQDPGSKSGSVIIEFKNEGSAADLIEERYLTLESGEKIEISSDFQIQKYLPSQEPPPTNPSLDDKAINLENISVPLAYQQIKKIEWENKISKIQLIKKQIEERLLSSLNNEIMLQSCSNPGEPDLLAPPCHSLDAPERHKDLVSRYYTGRSRSLSRSISPVSES